MGIEIPVLVEKIPVKAVREIDSKPLKCRLFCGAKPA